MNKKWNSIFFSEWLAIEHVFFKYESHVTTYLTSMIQTWEMMEKLESLSEWE